LITIVFITGQYANLYAQYGDKDSLLSVLPTLPEKNEKVDALFQLATIFYLERQFDSAIMHLEKASELAKELGYAEGLADVHYRRAMIFSRQGDYNAALATVEDMLRISDSLGDKTRLAKGYWFYGSTLSDRGDLDGAVKNLHLSRDIYEELEDSNTLVSVYNSLGAAFKSNGKFDSSAHYYYKAMAFSQELGNELNLATVLSNLGTVMYLMPYPKYDLAKQYINEAIAINKKYGRDYSLSICYSSMGNLFNKGGQLDSAMYYYELTEDLNIRMNNSRGLADNYNNIGEVFEQQGKFRQAMDNYNAALLYYREQGIGYGINISLLNIADIYVEQGRYQLAHIYYDSSIQMAREYGFLDLLKNSYTNKSDGYFRQGESTKAYKNLLTSIAIADSLFDIKSEEKLNEMRVRYEKEKDQAEILRLEKANLLKDLEVKQKTSQRNIFLFTGIGIIALLSFLFLYFRQRVVKDRIIAEQRIAKLEEEKKVLAARAIVEGQEEERKRIARELHDGLGVLLSTVKMQFTSLKDKSPQNQPLIERASKLLEQASGDVRKISHNMMPGLLTKLGLCEAVEDLFEKINETEGLEVEVEVPEDAERLPENKEIMLYRVIQELVNNTLKHAAAKKIRISLTMVPDALEVFYSDDGKGFNVEEKVESKSIGLQSIQSRINFLNGKLDIVSAPGEGTRYSMTIPV
jgi:signal transduction histidine kinase/Flp pilus assembly protein TadD